jgi:hypothetical protein
VNRVALVLALSAATAFAGDGIERGAFPPGTAYEPPALHAPEVQSKMFLYTETMENAKNELSLPISATGVVMVWMIPLAKERVGELNLTIDGASPRGTTEPFQLPDLGVSGLAAAETQKFFKLAKPGTYTAHVSVTGPEPAGVILVVDEPDSPITLTTWVEPLSHRRGEPISLHAELRNEDDPINDATVDVRLAGRGEEHASDVLRLEHDGDGRYSRTLSHNGKPGQWMVRFEARGKNGSFQRHALSEFITENTTARLTAIDPVVSGGTLNVTANLTNVSAGTYRMQLIVANRTQRTALAWAERTMKLKANDDRATIDIPISLIGSTTDIYLDVQLVSLEPPAVVGQIAQPFAVPSPDPSLRLR